MEVTLPTIMGSTILGIMTKLLRATLRVVECHFFPIMLGQSIGNDTTAFCQKIQGHNAGTWAYYGLKSGRLCQVPFDINGSRSMVVHL